MMEVDGKKREDDVTMAANTCEPCGRVGVSTEVAGLCRECEEYMCQLCFDHHLKAKVCMNHMLVDDIKSSVSVEDVEKCKQHDDEMIRYYCRTHDTVGCGDCMLSGGHNSCKPTNIKHVAKNFKIEKEFKQLLKQTEDLVKYKTKTAWTNQDNRLKSQALKQKLINEVRKFRNDLNSILDKAEANILSKIEHISSKNEQKISVVEKNTEILSAKLEEIKKKLDAESYNENVLFINAVGCRQQLKGLAKALADAKSSNDFENFRFTPDKDLNKMITTANALGKIEISRDDFNSEETNVSSLSSGTADKENVKISIAENDCDEKLEDCVICMDEMRNPKTLKCGHKFCSECIERHFEIRKTCPTCGAVCGVITGDQPPGTMNVILSANSCSGYSGVGQFVITYNFPDGTQESNHPNPGMRYRGFIRKAYLPDNVEGRTLLEMLKVAFERKLVFTIGSSRTTGQEGVITWNDIHHKTDPRPGTQFGYPDPSYPERLRDELAAKGITEDDIPKIPPDN